MADLSNLFKMASLGGLKRIAVGDYIVGTSGAEADLDTGLTTVDQVFATIKGTGPQGTQESHVVTVDFDGTDGLVDLYVFEALDSSAADSDTVTIMVIAIGE